MKKVILIVLAAILAVLALSCRKAASLSEKTADSVQYTFNVTVNERFGFDNGTLTKGNESPYYKTAWENGDRIFLFFKPASGSLLTDRYATLTYNGSTWEGVVCAGQSSLGGGGTLSAVYVYKLDSSVEPVFSDSKWTIGTGNVFYNCQTELSYTVSGNNEISVTLNLAAPADFVQFYVSGGADGALTCDKVKGWKDIAIGSDMTFSNVTCTGYMEGFANSGDSNVKEYYGRIVSETSLKAEECKFSIAKSGKVLEHTATPSSEARSFTMNLNKTDGLKWTEASGKLPGLFTVGTGADNKAGTPDDIIVRFSQGNLTYNVNASTDKWKFYERQYDCATDYDDTLISLFTWGYNAEKSIIPDGNAADNVSIETGNLSQDQDWGSQIGDGNTWRTLTTAEWRYLFSYDGSESGSLNYDNDTRRDKYKSDVTVCGKEDCVVLLPDVWDETVISLTDFASKTEYTNDSTPTWQAMENAGAVCLPYTGFRNGSEFKNGASRYWSSSAKTTGNAYYLQSSPPVRPALNGEKNRGFGVRLIAEPK